MPRHDSDAVHRLYSLLLVLNACDNILTAYSNQIIIQLLLLKLHGIDRPSSNTAYTWTGNQARPASASDSKEYNMKSKSWEWYNTAGTEAQINQAEFFPPEAISIPQLIYSLRGYLFWTNHLSATTYNQHTSTHYRRQRKPFGIQREGGKEEKEKILTC